MDGKSGCAQEGGGIRQPNLASTLIAILSNTAEITDIHLVKLGVD